MMDDHSPRALKQALRDAEALRLCPPDPVLFAPQPDALLKAHLDCCLLCQKRLQEYKELDGKPLAADPVRARLLEQGDGPRPGEVWRVHTDYGGFGGEPVNYYRPPLVLVLKREEEPAPYVQVVQVYGDPRLMGPGDVRLSGFGFAECWFSYALPPEDLELRFGAVDAEELEQARRALSAGHAPAEAFSTLDAFRAVELEAASFISLRSSFTLAVRADERAEIQNGLGDVDLARAETSLPGDHPEWSIPGEHLPLAMRLAKAAPSPTVRMQWAADAARPQTFNVATVESGLVRLKPATADIVAWERREGGLEIEGELPKDLPPIRQLIAWLELGDDGTLLKAERVAFPDKENPHIFQLRFDLPPDKTGALLMLVLR